MEWIVLFVVIVILGALAGGETFGETIRNGCGCLVMIGIALLILIVFVGTANTI